MVLSASIITVDFPHSSHRALNFINPRRAHALARVTVVCLCVRLSVCLSVRTCRSSLRLICVEFDKNARVESYDVKYLSRRS